VRRGMAVLLAGVLMQSAVAGASPAGKQRVETISYGPNPTRLIVADHGMFTASPGVSITSVEVYPKAGERWVSVTATDDSGLPVRVEVAQGGDRVIGRFCGGPHDPVRVKPLYMVELIMFSGTCQSGPSVATTGTLEVTFLRRPSS
jgi:hypothetical protein